MKIEDVKAGMEVCWTSQSGGYSTTKRGTVLWVGPPRPRQEERERIRAMALEKTGMDRVSIMSDHLGGYGVAVLVERVGKRGQPLVPRLYSPRAQHLVTSTKEGT